jgi:hypothetical protein
MTEPRPEPAKYQSRTARSAQTTAEMKNSFGLGKYDTNTGDFAFLNWCFRNFRLAKCAGN